MSGRIIGVDVGGTKVAVAALEDGVLQEPVVVPTETSDTERFLDQLADVIGQVGEATAVGIAVPSVVDFAAGAARFSVNIPLAGVPLRNVLSGRLDGTPVFVDNDATCAALAEAHSDPDRIPDVLCMLTLGTGVGGGIVLGGRSFRGATGAAAELGHWIVGADLSGGAPDSGGFPQPGSLEVLARGGALDDLAAASGAAHPEGSLGRRAQEGGGRATARDAVDAAREGDPEARRLLRLLGERLGVGIANAINAFDPEVVAVGGGVAAAGELLLEPAREAAWRFVLPGVGESTEIRVARHGGDAGLLGAALLARQELALELEGAM